MPYVEIDLDDFDDEDIAEEFYSRGLDSSIDDYVETRLNEIFIEFENGRREEAIILLERLFPRLRGLSKYLTS